MPETWRYRGQEISGEQIAFLREFIRAHPTSSRWKLSRQLCEALDWKQANGALRDVVCRGLLLMLDRAGEIGLPPVAPAHPRPAPDGAPTAGNILMDTTLLATTLKVEADRHRAGAAHGGRVAIQQPDGAPSLSRL